jgi:hypothetical protein
MSISTQQHRTAGRLLGLVGLIGVAIVVAGGLSWWLGGGPRKPVPTPGRPLLQNDDELFTDSHLQVQFTPPGNWSMQARSTEAPNTHKAERTVVKFKRLIGGLDVAWIKLSAIDVTTDQSPADYLTHRSPPEPGWAVKGKVEELTLKGLPAARITWSGPFDPDQLGIRNFSCEQTAVRRDKQILLFSGTYLTSDPVALKRIRAAVDSAVFTPGEFAKER